jgi:hypothetical protein
VESLSFHLRFSQLNPRKKAFKNLESLTREDQQASTPKRYQVLYILCGGVLIIPVSGDINPRKSLLKPWKIISVAKKYAILYFRHSSVLVQGERASTPQRY